MPVSSHHPDYDKNLARWDIVRSIVNNRAQRWIRTVDFTDRRRSDQYKQDAILTNYTNLTKVGLTGLVFKRDPMIEIPNSIAYVENDITGGSTSLLQLSQNVIGEVLETGRIGLLIDYPPVDSPQSALEDQLNGCVARVKPYVAETIINWREQQIGSRVMLTMVVLQETSDQVSGDGFEWVEMTTYRVLRLDENLCYCQDVYSEDGELLTTYMPTNAIGQPFNEIPFVFIGSDKNCAKPGNIPLYDLAVVNLGHYRNSADLEEAVFICGQPTLFMSGDFSIEEFKASYPGGIKFGARTGYYLGPNSQASLLQTNANQMVSAEMKRKEEQMVAIGARLIAPPGGRETATSARIRFDSQNSALYNVVNNCSQGLTKALQYVVDFMSQDLEIASFAINNDFYEEIADAGLISAQIMMLQNGIIGKEDIREYGRKTGLIEEYRSDEDIEEDLETDPLEGVDPSDDIKPSSEINDNPQSH